MRNQARGLSKSKLLSYLQCPRRLWLEVHKRDLREESDSAEAVMATGNQVGEIARDLHLDGILIESQDDLADALRQTAGLVAAATGKPLFEATFQHDGVLVRADILLQGPKGWDLREVKASTSVKDYHLQDAAIQTHVLKGAGLNLRSVSIQHINNQFVYPGDGRYQTTRHDGTVDGLFTHADVTKDARKLADREVEEWVAGARETLAERHMPEETDRCTDPFPCPFQHHCHADAPEFPVSCLPHIRKTRVAEFAEQGYVDIRELPAGMLSDAQERVRRITIAGKPELLPGAETTLAELGWPRHYVDFETVSLAVPMWKGTRPYERVPFQWSCHTESRDGSLTHQEFLDLSGDDPRLGFAKALIKAVGKRGPVLVYNKTFEGGVLQDLARSYPEMSDALLGIKARLVDLLPITKKHYYHPGQKGSWSIKDVLPTIAPDLNYASLEGDVQDGEAAMAVFEEALALGPGDPRLLEIDQALREYCKLDTLAMVRLADFLTTGKRKGSRRG